MHRLVPILLLLAAAPIVISVPVVAEIPPVTPAPRGPAAAIPVRTAPSYLLGA